MHLVERVCNYIQTRSIHLPTFGNAKHQLYERCKKTQATASIWYGSGEVGQKLYYR